MNQGAPEQLFRRYRERGDVEALGGVFDLLASELLLLAAHLGGGSAAEDLVQATFVDAIKLQHRWDAARPLAPWLVGILANHAARWRRDRARSVDAARLPERSSDAPADAAAAAELAQAVHAAVEALPPTYRQVLTLRLVHGLELQAIAHALGMPIGTVKTKLHRGTAILRRALPAGLAGSLALVAMTGRGLAAVREVVLAAHATVGAATTTAAAAAATGMLGLLGGLAMKKVLSVAAAAVLLLGGWLALAEPRTTPPATDDVAEPIAASTPLRAPEPAPAATATSVPEPEPVAAPSMPRTSLPTTGTLAVSARWSSDGAPAADVPLRAHLRKSPTSYALTTGADGSAQLELPPGDYLLVSNQQRTMHAWVTVTAGTTATSALTFDFDLRLCCTVVDGNGVPQAGAEIWRQNDPDHPQTASASKPYRALPGRTDARGELHYRGLPIRTLWARKGGLQPSRTRTLPSTAAGDLELRFVLGDAGCALRGVVVDPHGHPVAGATVAVAIDASIANAFAEERFEPVTVATDADGRFALTELRPGDAQIVAVAPGLAPALARLELARDAAADTTLTLAAGAVVAGRITHRNGTALAGAAVRVSMKGMPWFSGLLDADNSVSTDADGNYRIAALRSGRAFAEVRAASDLRARTALELVDGAHTEWNVALPLGEPLAGRVVDRDGAPLPRMRVVAQGPPTEGPWGGAAANAETRGDAEGRFRFEGLPDASYVLRVFDPEAEGAARDVWLAAAADVRPGRDDVELRVASTAAERGAITGRIVWPADCERVRLGLFLRDAAGRGYPVPLQILLRDSETFRVGPLPPGEYDVMFDRDGAMRVCHQGLRLAAGQTLELETLRLDRQHAVTVRLQRLDGAPVGDARALVWWTSVPMECRAGARPDEFVTPLLLPGQYHVSVRGRTFALSSAPLDVGDDPAQTIAIGLLPAAPLSVRVRAAATAPPTERWVGGLSCTLTDRSGVALATDFVQVDTDTGAVDVPFGLAAGNYVLECWAAPRGGRGRIEFEALAAGTPARTLELQLR